MSRVSAVRAPVGDVHKILVVDDQADNTAALAAALQLAGQEVRIAESGPSALAMVRAGFVLDIAFLDIGLPGLNGYELAEHLRALVPRVPLVAVTGYGVGVDRDRSRQAGFVRCLVNRSRSIIS